MTLPLDGLLVVDLSRAVAGPFCTLLLGDLGARVVKVEDPAEGDETRRYGPPFLTGPTGEPVSPYYLAMNRNKEGIALDLKSAEGRDSCLALCDRADVVIENFRPGVVERLGIGPKRVHERNPRAVYCSLSGFGQTGPWREKAGYDLIVQAMSGSMHQSGADAQGPVKVAYPVADLLAALLAGNAILAALYRREKDGRGRHVEISLLESMLFAMSSLAGSYFATGEEPARAGTAQPNIVPYQVFPCRDGLIATGAPNQRLWKKFCEALGHPEWTRDPRFSDNPTRTRNRAAMLSVIEPVLSQRTVAEWMERLEAHDIPCGPVNRLGQMLSDPVLSQRGVIAEMAHPSLGPIRGIANPIRIEGCEYSYRPAPGRGEHTERILREILQRKQPA